MFEDWPKEQILEEIEWLLDNTLRDLTEKDVIIRDGENVKSVKATRYLVELNEALLKLEKGSPPGIKADKYAPVVIAVAVEVLRKQYKLTQAAAISIVEKYTRDQIAPIKADTIKVYCSKYKNHPTFEWFAPRLAEDYPEMFPGMLLNNPDSTARFILNNLKDGRLKIPSKK